MKTDFCPDSPSARASRRSAWLAAFLAIGTPMTVAASAQREIDQFLNNPAYFAGMGVGDLNHGYPAAYREARQEALVGLAQAIGVRVRASLDKVQSNAGGKWNRTVVERVYTEVDRRITDAKDGPPILERSWRRFPKDSVSIVLYIDRAKYLSYAEAKNRSNRSKIADLLARAKRAALHGDFSDVFRYCGEASAANDEAQKDFAFLDNASPEIASECGKLSASLRCLVSPPAGRYDRNGRPDTPVFSIKLATGEGTPASGVRLKLAASKGRVRFAEENLSTGPGGGAEIKALYVDPSFGQSEIQILPADRGAAQPLQRIELRRLLKIGLFIDLRQDSQTADGSKTGEELAAALKEQGMTPALLSFPPSGFRLQTEAIDGWARIEIRLLSKPMTAPGFFTASGLWRCSLLKGDAKTAQTPSLLTSESGAYRDPSAAIRDALRKLILLGKADLPARIRGSK